MDLAAYRDFTRRLQANLQADDRVLGLIALGSMAEVNRLPDDWSDHDFFVITPPGEQEDFRQNPGWLPDHESIVLSIRETAHGLKVLYESGHLLEFAIFDIDELAQVHINDYRVLLDRADITSIVVNIAKRPAQSPFDATKQFTMVISLIYVGMGRYARGERLSAHAFIKHHLLGHLLSLLAHLLDGDNARLDNLDAFRRFEQVYPDVGAEISRVLLLPIPQAAESLLDLTVHHAPELAESHQSAVDVVRQYVKRAGNPRRA